MNKLKIISIALLSTQLHAKNCTESDFSSGVKNGSFSYSKAGCSNSGGVISIKNTVTITKSGTGTGTVTSSPARIDCGATCAGPFNYAQVVTLTATPAVGSIFIAWAGDPDCADGSVTMTDARNCTATFTLLPPNSLNITKAGTGAGKVTSTPAGIDCGSTCTFTFTAGQIVTLTAAPAVGAMQNRRATKAKTGHGVDRRETNCICSLCSFENRILLE